MKKIFILICLTLSLNTFAMSSLWLGLGNSTHNMLTAQNSASGDKKSIDLGPTVLMGTTLPFFISDFYFTPAIGYTKFFTKDGSSHSDIILQYHLTQVLSQSFLFQFGLSNTISRYSGNGGSLTLNNGTSTSTFYQASTSTTSYVASLDIGTEIVFTESISSRIQISVDHFLSSDRRRVSNLMTLNYSL
jgi:hypothetical protein